MDDRVDRVEQLGNPVGRDQPGEVEGVAEPQPLGLGDQAVAEDAVADEDEADLGIGLEDVGSGEQDVVVPFPLEEAGDGAEGNLIISQTKLAADLVARSGGVEERIDVHPAVDGRILLGATHALGQRLLGHRVADADDRVATLRRPTLQGDIEPVPHPDDSEGPNGRPWIVWTTAGTRSSHAAARPRMPAFELWVWTTSGLSRRIDSAEPAIGPVVGPWSDRADQLGHDLDLQAAGLRPLEEVALGPFGGAGDQGDVVAEM